MNSPPNQLYIYKFNADYTQCRDARAVVRGYPSTRAPKEQSHNRSHTRTHTRHTYIQARSSLANQRCRAELSKGEQETAALLCLQKIAEPSGRATSPPSIGTCSTAQRIPEFLLIFYLAMIMMPGVHKTKHGSTYGATKIDGGKGEDGQKWLNSTVTGFPKIETRAQVVGFTYSLRLPLSPSLLRTHTHTHTLYTTPHREGITAHGKRLTNNFRPQNGSYIPRGNPKHARTQI